jgi:glycosyltransferase involved in cell wall biosynthesis
VRKHAGVSVVVCCHNSAQRLPQVITHLAAQETPAELAWEVVVVDNSSTDETSALARRMWAQTRRPEELRVEHEARPGLSYARRTGICRSRYSCIVLCDDDNLLDADYITTAFRVLEEYPGVGAAGGQARPVADAPLPDWFHERAWSFAVGRQARASGDVTFSRGFLWGAGLVLRAAPIRHLYATGWVPLLHDRRGSELAAGGDSEICKWYIAGGWRLRYDDRLTLGHYIPSARLTEAYVKEQDAGIIASQRVLSAYDRCIQRDVLRARTPLLAPARLRSEVAVLAHAWKVSRQWVGLRRAFRDGAMVGPFDATSGGFGEERA